MIFVILFFCFCLNPLPSFGMRPQYARYKLTDLENKFLDAIHDNRLDTVKECVGQQVDINIGNECSDSLYLALYTGKLEIAHFLLQQKNINVNAVGMSGYCITTRNTILHLLCTKFCPGNPSISLFFIDLVMTRGANINAKDSDGSTPLNISTSFRELSITKKLIDAGALLTKDGVYNIAPLEQAVDNGLEFIPVILKSSQLKLEHIKAALARCHQFYDDPKQDPGYHYKTSYQWKNEQDDQKLKKDFKEKGQIVKKYYDTMRHLGYVHPQSDEWRSSLFPTEIGKIIAYHAARYEFLKKEH